MGRDGWVLLQGLVLLLVGCGPARVQPVPPIAASPEPTVQLGPAATGSVPSGKGSAPEAGDTAFLYQGFDHEWLRSLVGLRVPHRIGGFVSYVQADNGIENSQPWPMRGVFHLGQRVGVNADFMKPSGFFAAVYHPKLRVETGATTVSYTDDMPPGPDPSVDISRSSTLAVQVPEGAEEHVAIAILQGLSVSTHCDPKRQPEGKTCESNAMWLTRLHVQLGECTQKGLRRECPFTVEVSRAWTPDRGGFMGIMTKAIEPRLDVEINVHWALLTAPRDVLVATRAPAVSFEGRAREHEPLSTTVTLKGEPMAGPSEAQVGVTGFGFSLFAIATTPRSHRTGRYIDRWGFGVHAGTYRGETGELSVALSSQLRVPHTVADSGVKNELSIVQLQLRGEEARASASDRAVGSICEGGHPPEEPWHRCKSFPWGPERTEDIVAIRVTESAH